MLLGGGIHDFIRGIRLFFEGIVLLIEGTALPIGGTGLPIGGENSRLERSDPKISGRESAPTRSGVRVNLPTWSVQGQLW